MEDVYMSKKITVTVEQEGKKALMFLELDDKGGLNVKTTFEPSLDKEHPQEKDLLVMKIIEVLRGE
jgi:hypothetical protein